MAARVHFETVATGGGGGGSGTVTNVSALNIGTTGTNLSSTVINSTTTPVITLNVPTASAVNRGALSSADWSTFNSKQSLLVSGTNIKTVNSTSLLGSGNLAVQAILVSGTNIKTVNSTSLLGSGNLAVQAILVSGTNIKTVNSTSLLGSGDLAVQAILVSGTNIKTVNGNSLLGSGDLVISGGGGSPSGVAGSVQFSDGTNFASDNANFFWDDTNNRLGIGTNAPTSALQVSIPTTGTILTLNNSATPAQIFKISKPFSALNLFDIGTTATNFKIFDSYIRISVGSATTNFSILNNGNIGIGIGDNSPVARVDIKGSGTTASTNALLVQNSAGTALLTIRDDGVATFGSALVANSFTGNLRTDFINTSNNAYTVLQTNPANGNGKFYESVSIGTSSDPVASAKLELVSTTKGFLPPRMTTVQRNAIVTPAAGLMVYDTDANKLYLFTTLWEQITSL